VDGVLRASRGSLNLEEVEAFVAVGGDARFAAKQVGHPTASADLMAVEAPEFDRLVERCQHYTSEELSRRYGMPFAEAETLNPALVIYQELLHRTQVPRMLVSQASMRDGLLLDLASRVTGKEDETLLVGISRAALALAEKYRADLNHAQLVAEVAVRLFDALLPDHGLASRHRLLLHVAALLHEIGGFVSNRSHHKHSEYLIANSEIFGLSRAETAVVAQIARYHRRSMPRATHPGYMVLPREDRVVVNKLAALLRVADALARNPTGQTRHARIERHGEELLITVPGVKDLILERHAVAAKGDLFEEVYGMRVRLEEV
jgi:exopolyphosphatase/guanosine-5'-triphosphate,3'-diphosphate pyrophosphatase